MDTTMIQPLVEQLRSAASVSSVYGEPVEHADKTVIPVARIAYGFGGGYGSSDGVGENAEGDEGEGAGGGGGVAALPVGVVEITDTDTRFIRFNDRKRAIRGLFFGVVIGLLLGLARRKRS
ncbi:spore germination protein GerW family protein [Haladaptatus sp. DJG-WS-42]|uniref:GerW family sporulation protein n=1 Tax=Haladaptatus sp. DJG-WS-42 TaxID=3120516 RepID=UPI0030D25134